MQGEASGATESESITTTELLQFWQAEAHYFEERARAQGASATAMISVSVAALAAGAIPLADGTTLSSALVLAVPLLALLLWVTAVRQLIEMYRLTAYCNSLPTANGLTSRSQRSIPSRHHRDRAMPRGIAREGATRYHPQRISRGSGWRWLYRSAARPST